MTKEYKKKLEKELETLSEKEIRINYELRNIKTKENRIGLTDEEILRKNDLIKKLIKISERKEEIEMQLETARRASRNGLLAFISFVSLAGFLGFFLGKPIGNCMSQKIGTGGTSIANSDKSITATATPEPIKPSIDAVLPTSIATATPVPTAKPTATPAPTAKPTATPEPSPVYLTEDEEIAMEASNIYEQYVMPLLAKGDNPTLEGFATVEKIEDIIRMSRGMLPANIEYSGESTIGGTADLMNYIFANQGNHNVLYPMDFSKLYPAGSDEAKYIQTYDDIYRQIAIYRAEGNGDGVVEQIGALGQKVYNEWHKFGMYGGYNPYLFREKRYFILQAATSRFSNYVREYLKSNDLTVCIPTCYDVETGKYKEVEIRDIFEALYTDNATSKNGAISIVDETGNPIRVYKEAFDDAKVYFDKLAAKKEEEAKKELDALTAEQIKRKILV